jgi:agmatine deiminase
MSTPIICTSQHLRTTPLTQRVAEELHSALESLGIEHLELANTNDYWCRDYMPVRIFDDGTYSKYKYRPDYLLNYKSKRKYITAQADACKGLKLFTPTDMHIIFDGGNYVRCSTKVIITDKIFSENPAWPANELLSHLHDALCADIVVIPWDMRDPFGHADGMVAVLDDGRLLLNNYIQEAGQHAFYRRLRKILDAHFDVVDLSYDCELEPDSWCYLNFLNLPNAILLPALSEHHDCPNDKEAIRVMKGLFPNKEIVPIYAKPIVKEGGALHCVTWEYVPKESPSYPNLAK